MHMNIKEFVPILQTYVSSHTPNFGDDESALTLLYEAFAECNIWQYVWRQKRTTEQYRNWLEELLGMSISRGRMGIITFASCNSIPALSPIWPSCWKRTAGSSEISSAPRYGRKIKRRGGKEPLFFGLHVLYRSISGRNRTGSSSSIPLMWRGRWGMMWKSILEIPATMSAAKESHFNMLYRSIHLPGCGGV